MRKLLLSLIIAIIFGGIATAQSTIQLPEPQKTGGMPLMESLAKRSTARAFSTKEISNKQLSNILWASFGINRADGKRTAPSTMNFQGTDIYVLLKSGAYIFDAKNNKLTQVLSEDIRVLGGTQAFVKDAPVQLILVSDLSKLGKGSNEEKMNISNIDAGYISQNIYLCCVSEGLVTGARGSVDHKALAAKLKLRQDQSIVIAHSVGYAK
jgi:hypothetical protein